VSLIGEVCKLHHKSLVALLLPREGASEDEVSASLKELRPHARMLVVASGADYVEAMLSAMRA